MDTEFERDADEILDRLCDVYVAHGMDAVVQKIAEICVVLDVPLEVVLDYAIDRMRVRNGKH